MNTINNAIPFVPENTTDPAAGLNLSLNQIDALLQLAVVSVGENTPPGSPSNGARYIVGTAPTGAWASRANQVAQWLDGAWRFFTTARYALNTADGLWYVRQGATWGVSPAEWTAETVSQVEAEAGTATTRRAWTAQRVWQAIYSWWHSVSSAWGRGFVSSADAAAGRTALELGNAATRTALGSTGALYSRDSILGTVSQSGGVPTGAIIQRGSNANGEFVRYADGTQICTNSVFAYSDRTVASGVLFRTENLVWTFPSVFAFTPVCSGKPRSGVPSANAWYGLGTARDDATTSTTFAIHGDSSFAGNGAVMLVAIGRWY